MSDEKRCPACREPLKRERDHDMPATEHSGPLFAWTCENKACGQHGWVQFSRPELKQG